MGDVPGIRGRIAFVSLDRRRPLSARDYLDGSSRRQIPNGPVLKAADGEPIRSAGILILEDVFDAATGDYITTNESNESFNGPHLAREGVDICGPSVAYLLDP